MRVLFIQNIKGVGQMGDIKNVTDGYARNFLIPRKLAKSVTGNITREAEIMKQRIKIEKATNKEEAIAASHRLESMTLEIKSDANTKGHLYGSVDAKIICRELETRGIKIAENKIILERPIKEVGDYEVKLELFPEIISTIKVAVIRD